MSGSKDSCLSCKGPSSWKNSDEVGTEDLKEKKVLVLVMVLQSDNNSISVVMKARLGYFSYQC